MRELRQMLIEQFEERRLLVMDNLSSHKNRTALKTLDSTGVIEEFLPPYSSNYNPIENIFSNIKSTVRQIAARTVMKQDRAIAKAISMVTSDDCLECFRKAGYGLR